MVLGDKIIPEKELKIKDDISIRPCDPVCECFGTSDGKIVLAQGGRYISDQFCFSKNRIDLICLLARAAAVSRTQRRRFG